MGFVLMCADRRSMTQRCPGRSSLREFLWHSLTNHDKSPAKSARTSERWHCFGSAPQSCTQICNTCFYCSAYCLSATTDAMVMPVDESKKAKGGGEHVPHIHKAPTALCYNKQKTTATTITITCERPSISSKQSRYRSSW